MFSDTGLECLVQDAAHIPRFFVGDMSKSVNGDLYADALQIPPGVEVRPNARTLQNNGNFLIGRVKRIRGG